MEKDKLKKIIELHAAWIMNRCNGARADLIGAELIGADLRGADLRGADLHGACLRDADLFGANLGGADLVGANLIGADLFGANLGGANLSDALFIYADYARQYILYVIKGKELYFIAGCHTFTYNQAIYHWTYISKQPAYVEAIKKYKANNDLSN